MISERPRDCLKEPFWLDFNWIWNRELCLLKMRTKEYKCVHNASVKNIAFLHTKMYYFKLVAGTNYWRRQESHCFKEQSHPFECNFTTDWFCFDNFITRGSLKHHVVSSMVSSLLILFLLNKVWLLLLVPCSKSQDLYQLNLTFCLLLDSLGQL